MKMYSLREIRKVAANVALITVCTVLLTACGTAGKSRDNMVACSDPFSQRLDMAIGEAQTRLSGGACKSQFNGMFDSLLAIGEGDPKIENKRLFSSYLQWASDKGIISPLQAKQTYTRYFGLKFVSGLSDYNTCTASCPVKNDVLASMRSEMNDKSRGMLKIASDQETYALSSKLYQELELVLTATCEACASQ